MNCPACDVPAREHPTTIDGQIFQCAEHGFFAVSSTAIDGRALSQGEAVFIPANARPMRLYGAGAEVLAAYSDMIPTAIWRFAPEPDPSAAALARPMTTTSVVPAFAQGMSPPGFAAAT